MHAVHYQRWNPPQSPIRIEFPSQLPVELAMESGTEARGSLYGLLLGGEIRVLGARGEDRAVPVRGRRRDESLSGLEQVGIFVYRARGEVFLEESDLERFEAQRAAVALVIVGGRAGFFVRQADGSIQTIRSHEEFALAGVEAAAGEPPVAGEASPVFTPQATLPVATAKSPERDDLSKPAPESALKPAKPSAERAQARRRAGSKAPHWPRTTAVFLAIPLAAVAYFRPLSSAPPQLQVRQVGEAVAISWNPMAVAHGGKLEILDGSNSAQVSITPDQSSLTYEPGSGRVEVRMIADTGEGPARLESAMLTLDLPAKPTAVELPVDGGALRTQIESLDTEASQLRGSVETGHKRIARLQKTIARLTGSKSGL